MENVKKPGTLKRERNTNLELYRIITMLLIIAHHYVVNSGLTAVGAPILANPTSIKSLFLQVFGAFGKTGINCFVLITGYFMCGSNISAKKFAKLLAEVLLYRLVLNGIFWITGYADFSFLELFKIILPVRSIASGFTPAFLVFYLLIPFINTLINNINQKQHIYLLLLMSFVYIILATVPVIFSVTMNYVSWFIVLFLFASYVKKYPAKVFANTKLWGFASLFSLMISIVSVVACAWLSKKTHKNLLFYFVTDSNTFLAFATAFSSFMFFKNVKIPYSRFINTVAASCFGVFLIHANSDAMRKWLWKDVLHNVEVFEHWWMPIHAVISVIAIYAICTVIDYLRIKFVEKPLFILWDKKWDKICAAYKKTEKSICEKLNIQD